MFRTISSQNSTPFYIDGVELCISPKKEYISTSTIKPIQKHTNNIIEIVDGNENLEECDGLYTKRSEITLTIGTSDCAPICFISN